MLTVEGAIETGRPLAAATVDAFEAAIRAATDVQRQLAAATTLEPIQSTLRASADYTRDLGAVIASRSRWLLDV